MHEVLPVSIRYRNSAAVRLDRSRQDQLSEIDTGCCRHRRGAAPLVPLCQIQTLIAVDSNQRKNGSTSATPRRRCYIRRSLITQIRTDIEGIRRTAVWKRVVPAKEVDVVRRMAGMFASPIDSIFGLWWSRLLVPMGDGA